MLCYLVVSKVHWHDKPEPNFEPGLLSLISKAYTNKTVWLGLFLVPLSILLSAWRWHILLKAGRIRLPYNKTLLLTVMGNFFNHALPSLTGGDVIRAYYIMRYQPRRKSQAVISLIADRLAGLGGLAIVCVAAVLLGWADPLVAKIRLPILLVVALLTLAAAVVFVPGASRFLRLTWLVEKLPFQNFIKKLKRAVRLYSVQPGVWITALGVSVLIHFMLLTCVYLGGRVLAPGPGYHQYLVLLPPTWMISAVAVTPGALAWMEMWYQTFFARVGVSATSALGLSLFHRFALLLWALPGLIIYLKGPGLKAAESLSVGQVEEILETRIDQLNHSNNQDHPDE